MSLLRVFLALLFGVLLSAGPSSAPPTFTGSDLGINGTEVRWGDYDSDGNLDFIVNGFNGSRFVRVYRGNGAGAFTLDSNSSGMLGLQEGPCLWGDYDNDGFLDVAIAGWNGGGTSSRIYRLDGSPPATSYTALPNLRGLKGADGAWFDYDNDGDLDLMLTGESYDTGMADDTLMFRNNGDGTFTQAVSLLGTYVGGCSIGDFDRDGDIDITLIGRTAGVVLYKNDGNGGFVNSGSLGLPALENSSIAFGDFDNDGDLDVMVTGNSGAALVGDIYRNDSGTFVALGAGLTPVRLGCVTWGDYDNDGYLDLLMVGSDNTPALNPLAFLYRNNGNGTFTEAAVGLTGVSNQSSASWGDYDNDGDLDIILAGVDGTGTSVVKLFRNDSTVANTPPTVPSGFAATVVGNRVTFNWSASSDAQTVMAAAMTYNLRVGTTPGGQQVMTPMADLATGRRRIAARGNAEQNLAWSLRSLPPGVYYCSVQAIDNGSLASGWSAEVSFTVTTPGTLAVTAMSPGPGSSLGGSPSTVTATMSAPIDPATVSAATVNLTGRGPDNAFDTVDDVPITPTSIGVAGNVITLDLSGVVLAADVYRLKLDGTAAAPAAHAGLFGYWKLTEGSGPSTPDSSGNGRHGTLNGATWGTGLFGGALTLNGGAGRVDIDTSTVLTSWTAAMWVCRTGQVGTSAATLIDAIPNTGTSLRLEQLATGNDVGITEYNVIDYGFGYFAPLNQWAHLTYASDGANAKLYVNGNLEGTSFRAFNLTVDKFGSVSTSRTDSAKCRLSEVQVYNRVLTPGEIGSLTTLTGCIRNTTGGVLNGEYTGTFPSGDAAPGGDFAATFGVNLPAPPTAFALVSPANGAVGVGSRPSFVWSAAAGATSYTVQVASDPAFTSLLVDQSGIFALSFTPPAPLPAGAVCYWRVSAVNAGGSTPASGAPFSLTTLVSVDIILKGACGLLGLEAVVLLLVLRRRFRTA